MGSHCLFKRCNLSSLSLLVCNSSFTSTSRGIWCPILLPAFDINLVGPQLFSRWNLVFFMLLCQLPLIHLLVSFENFVAFTFSLILSLLLGFYLKKIPFCCFRGVSRGNKVKWMFRLTRTVNLPMNVWVLSAQRS